MASRELDEAFKRSVAVTGSDLGEALNALLNPYVARSRPRPQPIGYEDEPEITHLPDDEGDDEDTELAPDDYPMTERQRITLDVMEAGDVDREYRGEDE